MKVMLVPLHYFVSDKDGSEISWSKNIFFSLSKFVEVTAIAGKNEGLEIDAKTDAKMRLVTHPRKPNYIGLGGAYNRLLFPSWYYKTALNLMKKEKFDIIHHVLPFSPNTGNPLAIKNKIKEPFVIGPAMMPQKEMSYEEFCFWLGIKKGITSKSLYYAFKNITLIKKKEFEKTMKRVDRLICVNKETAEFYSKYIEKEKIRLIPAGIDTNKFSPKNRVERDKIRIIGAGNLISRKGFLYLIDAVKLLKDLDFELVIIGQGPEEEMLRTRARELGNKVIFKGQVPFSLIQEEYRSSDIFCNPTLSEPFGQVNLEAMACGLPVVGSNVGGLKEIITEDTGIRVEPGDVRALSEALRMLISDEKLRRKLGHAARKRAVEFYSWDVIASKYVDVYREVL